MNTADANTKRTQQYLLPWSRPKEWGPEMSRGPCKLTHLENTKVAFFWVHAWCKYLQDLASTCTFLNPRFWKAKFAPSKIDVSTCALGFQPKQWEIVGTCEHVWPNAHKMIKHDDTLQTFHGTPLPIHGIRHLPASVVGSRHLSASYLPGMRGGVPGCPMGNSSPGACEAHRPKTIVKAWRCSCATLKRQNGITQQYIILNIRLIYLHMTNDF